MAVSMVLLLVIYAFGLSIGQLLFKISADRAKLQAEQPFLTAVIGDGYFIASVLIYGALTLLWVWVLTRVPLSRAYPFLMLAFVLTPLLAGRIFGEQLDAWYFVALGLILSGVGVLVWKTT